MKILLFWPYFHPESSGEARAKRGEAFAKYCSKKGIEVYVIVPKKKNVCVIGTEYKGYIVKRIKTYDTIRESHSFLKSLFYFPISVTTLIKIIKKMNPDLIISSTPDPFMPFEGLLIAKYLRIPYIFDMGDSWHLLRWSHNSSLRIHLKMYIEHLCATHSDIIFVVTPTLKQIVSEGYNIDPKKIKVVYNGADLDPIPDLERNETIDLIHLSSPRYHYDTIKLIESFSIIMNYCPRTSLLFIGCKDDDYVKKIKRYAKEKGVLNNIEFAPFIPHEKVPYELSKAKIGIISIIDRPEYKAAIGIKVFEYMSAGLPTAYLGPSDSEQEKIIIDNNIGISASNISDFAEKVIYLIKNKNIRDSMGANARTCIKKYTWEKIITEAIDEHINSLVSKVE